MTKNIRLWKDLGNTIADRWGRFSEVGIDDHIKSLSVPEFHTCLLAAAVTQLTALTNELRELRLKQTHCDPVVGISMGMLTGLLSTVPPPPDPPGTLLKSLPKDGLGSRALRALYRSGVKVLEDLTFESLLGIHGCGAATRNEILDWADTQRELILLSQQDSGNDTGNQHHDATGTSGGSGVAPQDGEETHATRKEQENDRHDSGGTGRTPEAPDPVYSRLPDGGHNRQYADHFRN